MTYAQSFSLSDPTGLEEANTLDEIIRNVKIALNERFTDILGVDLSGATDPQRVTKIVIPAAGMNVRDSSDANNLIAFTNAGTAIRNASFTGTAPTLPSGSVLTSPTLTGTLTGGTVAPTTLTVPSGTAITNASLTTPALVNAAIVGGSASGLTGLTVTGTPVITGNLTVTGTVTAGSLSGPTTVPAANVTAGTFQNAAYTFPNDLNVSGTLAPTTLTVPNGTTMSGATLNNTTFTGTVTGIDTYPSVIALNLGANVNLNFVSFTNLLTQSVSAGSYMVFGKVYGNVVAANTTNQCGIMIEIFNSVNSVIFRALNTDNTNGTYSGVTNVFGTFTLSSSGTISLRALAQGNTTGSPTAYGTLGTTEYSGLYIMRIA